MGKCRTLVGKERVVHSLRPWNENVQLRDLWISICVAACFGLCWEHVVCAPGPGVSKSAKATRNTTRCAQVSARGGSRVGWGSLCFQVSHSTSNAWPYSLIPNYGKEGACWGPKPSPCPEATGTQGVHAAPSRETQEPCHLAAGSEHGHVANKGCIRTCRFRQQSPAPPSLLFKIWVGTRITGKLLKTNSWTLPHSSQDCSDLRTS